MTADMIPFDVAMIRFRDFVELGEDAPGTRQALLNRGTDFG